eukprot:112968-Chlamydomonas_euryale.AAC.3
MSTFPASCARGAVRAAACVMAGIEERALLVRALLACLACASLACVPCLCVPSTSMTTTAARSLSTAIQKTLSTAH